MIINNNALTYSDLIALKAQSSDIARASDKLRRAAAERLSTEQIIDLPQASADYIEEQLNVIESTINALRRRFPRERREMERRHA